MSQEGEKEASPRQVGETANAADVEDDASGDVFRAGSPPKGIPPRAAAALGARPKITLSRPFTPTKPITPQNLVQKAAMERAAADKAAAEHIRVPVLAGTPGSGLPGPPPPASAAPANTRPSVTGRAAPPAGSPFAPVAVSRTATQPPPPVASHSPHALAAPPIVLAPPLLEHPPIAATLAPTPPPHGAAGPLGLRADVGHAPSARPSARIVRTRAYSFVTDERGLPIELGSGRFGKVFLGEERWLESKTDFRRPVVIKALQKGVAEEDLLRFQLEKELLERVQGHPNIVKLHTSGESEDPEFLPPSLRDKVESEFVILERLEMSLEERLKGSRNKGQKDDLLRASVQERVFRVLDYMIPVASAVEFAHLVRNVTHRDIKPANILIGLPDPALRGSTLEVRLADFNVAKANEEQGIGMTRLKAVPGTLFFQSPEQETNTIELLVNVSQGSPEVEYFEDFYIHIAKNDEFSLFNRSETYAIESADRIRKRLVLGRPFVGGSEQNIRARIQKSVGRPADIYSLGALLYYLISGAYSNPKTLYDNFHKFIEFESAGDKNMTIEAYLDHEYSTIQSLRAPKTEGGAPVAPADRFFSYKHFLDGNGELIDRNVMKIVAKCMIRNKPDSYCQAHELETRGISDLVQDLINLYMLFGVHPSARPQYLARTVAQKPGRPGFVGFWDRFLAFFRRKPK